MGDPLLLVLALLVGAVSLVSGILLWLDCRSWLEAKDSENSEELLFDVKQNRGDP